MDPQALKEIDRCTWSIDSKSTLSTCSAAATVRGVLVGSFLLQQALVVSSGAVLVVDALEGGSPALGLALASRLVIHETEA
jgi:hypothetical protein